MPWIQCTGVFNRAAAASSPPLSDKAAPTWDRAGLALGEALLHRLRHRQHHRADGAGG
jgi:hypothetical protein